MGGAIALLVAAPVSSLAAHFASVLGHDLHPGRDHSIYELNTIAFLHGKQLVGPYSQFGWHHLGPAFFAVLAGPYALSGFRSLSLVLTMLVWSAAMVVAFIATARRHAGPSGAVVAVAALWGFLEYENRLPLYNYWAPFFTYLAVPLCTALIARVSSNAASRALPWALSLTSVLVQTHIGVAPALGAFWFLAIAVRLGARRRGMIQEALLTRRAAWTSAALVFALWMPPIVAELGGFGNWSRIMAFFGSEQRHPSWPSAFDRAAAEIVAPLRGLVGHDAYSYVRKAPPGMAGWTLLSIAYAAALVAGAVFAWRAKKPVLTTVTGGALVASLLCPLAIRRVSGPIEPHYVAWVGGTTVAGLTGLAGVASMLAAAHWRSTSALRRRARTVAPWVACALFSARLATARGFVPEAHLCTPGLTRLADRIDARLHSAGPGAVVVHGTPVTMPWHFNLGLELYRRGYSVRFVVSRADFYVGPFWTRLNDARATVHLVTRKVNAKGELLGCEDPPSGSLIVGSVCAWFETTTP